MPNVEPPGEYAPDATPNGEGVVQQYWPYDGPHDRERVLEAAEALASLVRYLNNATGPGNGAVTLRYAPNVDALLGRVQATVGGLDQLVGQLSEATVQHADDDTLYDDRRDRPGKATAELLVEEFDDVGARVADLYQQLDRARLSSTHLGHDL